jgi:hypothetical protein
MELPPRLEPLLAQFDFACERLVNRIAGPHLDSGDGELVQVLRMTDDEYLREPVPGSWSVRPRSSGPGHRAGALVALRHGADQWRASLLAADDKALDTVGHSSYPDGSDPEERFIDVV